jgi:hypothetical protein
VQKYNRLYDSPAPCFNRLGFENAIKITPLFIQKYKLSKIDYKLNKIVLNRLNKIFYVSHRSSHIAVQCDDTTTIRFPLLTGNQVTLNDISKCNYANYIIRRTFKYHYFTVRYYTIYMYIPRVEGGGG